MLDNPFPKFALCLKLDNTMFSDDQYQLLDFGDGRKLERLGAYIVDRPSRAAEGVHRRQPRQWGDAAARFEIDRSNQGHWVCPQPLSPQWVLDHGSLTFQLTLTSFRTCGAICRTSTQLGLGHSLCTPCKTTIKCLESFCLHRWHDVSGCFSRRATSATLMLPRARLLGQGKMREHSGLGDAPIRWIVDDVPTFVRREVRRKNQYDAIILDPPSYGHGPKNEVWKLTDHLPKLLQSCRQLLSSHRAFVLLTCHTSGIWTSGTSSGGDRYFFR